MTRRNNNNSNKQGGAKGRQRKVKEEQNSPKSEDSSTSCPTEMTQKRESLENGANSGRNNKFTGLKNLGQTCFFNSVVQCIGPGTHPYIMLYQHSVRHLYENLIISEQFELKIPGEKASKKGPRKPALILTVPSCEIPLYDVKGRMHLFETFAHFMTNLCSNRVPSPAQLFGQIGTKVPRFRSGRQQDAHELLRFFLDELRNEELFRFRSSLIGAPEFGRFDAPQIKEIFRALVNRGIIVPAIDAAFGGYLVQTVRCHCCSHISTSFEQFFDMSLPIVRQKCDSQNARPSPIIYKPPMARGQQNDTKMAESSTPKRKGSSFGRMIIGDVVADPSSDDVSDEKSDEKNHNKSVEVKEETGVDEKSTKYPVKPTKNMASTGNSQAPKDNKKSDKQQPIQQSSYQKKKLRKDAKKKVKKHTKPHQAAPSKSVDDIADADKVPENGEGLNTAQNDVEKLTDQTPSSADDSIVCLDDTIQSDDKVPTEVNLNARFLVQAEGSSHKYPAGDSSNSLNNAEDIAPDQRRFSRQAVTPSPQDSGIASSQDGDQLDGEDASFESAITEVTSIDLGSEVVEETLLNGECPPEKKSCETDVSNEIFVSEIVEVEEEDEIKSVKENGCDHDKKDGEVPDERLVEKKENEECTENLNKIEKDCEQTLEEQGEDKVGEENLVKKEQNEEVGENLVKKEQNEEVGENLVKKKENEEVGESFVEKKENEEVGESFVEKKESKETHDETEEKEEECEEAVDEIEEIPPEIAIELAQPLIRPSSSSNQDTHFEGSLLAALEQFTGEEVMSESIGYKCPQCCSKRDEKGVKKSEEKDRVEAVAATKRSLIFLPPLILTIHLNRFEQTHDRGNRLRTIKVNDHIQFPFTVDLGPFCSRRVQRVTKGHTSVLYSLYGLVQHMGGMGGGHYIAYVKTRVYSTERIKGLFNQAQETSGQNGSCFVKLFQQLKLTENENYDEKVNIVAYADDSPSKKTAKMKSVGEASEEDNGDDSCWYRCDDSRVSQVEKHHVQRAQAYLLFYERVQ